MTEPETDGPPRGDGPHANAPTVAAADAPPWARLLALWRDNDSPEWRSVRAVVPARRYLRRLELGEVGGADELVAGLAELAASPASVHIDTLQRLARLADAAEIAHALRHGAARALADEHAHEARIELTTDGLVWHHPRPEILADTELARLAWGELADVVPPALNAACRRALKQLPSQPDRALWWWQRGVHIPAERVASEARLEDALTWSQQAINRSSTSTLPTACLHGTLQLARAAPQPLDRAEATAVCALIRHAQAGGAIALQGVALGAEADRAELLTLVGVRLHEATSPPLALRCDADTRLTELPHG